MFQLSFMRFLILFLHKFIKRFKPLGQIMLLNLHFLTLLHKLVCPYTPQQNSVVQRKHQYLLNVARSLIFQSNVPLTYWSDCVLTATFFINRLPSHFLANFSSLERLQGKCPDYSQLKNFVCLCYASTLLKDRNKFFSKSFTFCFTWLSSGF